MCLTLKSHSILPASVKWWILYEEVIWCLEGLEPGLVDVSTFTWSGATFGCWAEVKAIWCLSVDPGSPSSPRGSLGPLQLPHHPENLCPKNRGRMHPSAVAVSEASSVHRRLFLCWFTGRVSVLGTVGWWEGRREASLSTCKWWGHSVSPQLDFNASSPICSNRPLIRLFLKKKKNPWFVRGPTNLVSSVCPHVKNYD